MKVLPVKETILKELGQKTNGFGRAANQPPGTDKEVNRILKKSGAITFDRMPDKLKYPTHNEQRQCPAPPKEEKWPRDRDQGDANRMTEFVQRVLMLRFVVFEQCRRHGLSKDSLQVF